MNEDNNIARRLAQGLLWASLLLALYLISCFLDIWGRLPVMAQGICYGLTLLGMAVCLGQSIRHKAITYKPLVLLTGFLVVVAGGLGLSAGEDAERRLMLAFKPPAFFDYPVPHVEATLAPPAYSGQNSLHRVMLLSDSKLSGLNPVPEGSTLVVTITNTPFRPSLHLEGRTLPFERLEDGSFQVETLITHAPVWAIYQGSRRLGRWPVTLLEDTPPVIRKFDVIEEQGTQGYLVLDLDVEDDYAIASARVEVGGQEAKQLLLEGVFSYGGRIYMDVGASDFAGKTAPVQLTIEDEAGQTQTRIVEDVLIPARPFRDYIARHIMDIREAIKAGTEEKKILARRLMALGLTEKVGAPPVYYMALRSAYWRLKSSPSPEEELEVRKMLWDLALLSEAGEKGHVEEKLLAGLEGVNLALLQGKPHDEIRKTLGKLDQVFWQYNRARGAVNMVSDDAIIDFRAIHRLYSRLLGHVKGNQYERARGVGNYIRDSLVHHNIGLLTREGYGRFIAADKGQAIVANLIALQKMLLAQSFDAGRNIRIATTDKQEIFEREVTQNMKDWVRAQRRLSNSLKEISHRLSRVGIETEDIVSQSESLSQDIVVSLKAGEMENVASGQTQMLVVLNNLKHMLSDELSGKRMFGE